MQKAWPPSRWTRTGRGPCGRRARPACIWTVLRAARELRQFLRCARGPRNNDAGARASGGRGVRRPAAVDAGRLRHQLPIGSPGLSDRVGAQSRQWFSRKARNSSIARQREHEAEGHVVLLLCALSPNVFKRCGSFCVVDPRARTRFTDSFSNKNSAYIYCNNTYFTAS